MFAEIKNQPLLMAGLILGGILLVVFLVWIIARTFQSANNSNSNNNNRNNNNNSNNNNSNNRDTDKDNDKDDKDDEDTSGRCSQHSDCPAGYTCRLTDGQCIPDQVQQDDTVYYGDTMILQVTFNGISRVLSCIPSNKDARTIDNDMTSPHVYLEIHSKDFTLLGSKLQPLRYGQTISLFNRETNTYLTGGRNSDNRGVYFQEKTKFVSGKAQVARWTLLPAPSSEMSITPMIGDYVEAGHVVLLECGIIKLSTKLYLSGMRGSGNKGVITSDLDSRNNPQDTFFWRIFALASTPQHFSLY